MKAPEEAGKTGRALFSPENVAVYCYNLSVIPKVSVSLFALYSIDHLIRGNIIIL